MRILNSLVSLVIFLSIFPLYAEEQSSLVVRPPTPDAETTTSLDSKIKTSTSKSSLTLGAVIQSGGVGGEVGAKYQRYFYPLNLKLENDKSYQIGLALGATASGNAALGSKNVSKLKLELPHLIGGRMVLIHDKEKISLEGNLTLGLATEKGHIGENKISHFNGTIQGDLRMVMPISLSNNFKGILEANARVGFSNLLSLKVGTALKENGINFAVKGEIEYRIDAKTFKTTFDTSAEFKKVNVILRLQNIKVGDSSEDHIQLMLEIPLPHSALEKINDGSHQDKQDSKEDGPAPKNSRNSKAA